MAVERETVGTADVGLGLDSFAAEVDVAVAQKGLNVVVGQKGVDVAQGGNGSVSLADVLASDVRLAWDEAVTIVEELCGLLLQTKVERPVPDRQHVFITQAGHLSAKASGTGTPDPVEAARLLHDLLATAVVPAPLRLFVSQAISTSPHASLHAFAEALTYFAKAGGQDRIKAVYDRTVESLLARPAADTKENEEEPKKAASGGLQLLRGVPVWAVLGAAASAAVATGIAAWFYLPSTGASTTVAREPSVEAVRASIPPQAPPVAATPAAADRAATSPAAPVASPAPGPPAASGQTAAAAPAPASASSRPSWWSFSTWMSWPWSSSRPAPATETAAAAPAAKPAAPGRRARTPGAIQAAGNAVSATIPPGEPAQPAEPAPTAPAVPLAAALSSAAAVPTNRSNPDPPALAPIDESTEAYIFGTIEPNVPVYSKANSEVVPPDLVRPQLLPPIFAPKVGAAVNQMELTISTAGAVERARFLVGPHRMADMMILSSAKTWRFTPASKDGQPVRYRTVVAFEAGP